MNWLVLLIFGFTLFFIGSRYQFASINRADQSAFITLHKTFRNSPFVNMFRIFWFFGTSSFLLFILLVLSLYNLRYGVMALGAILLITLLERAIKHNLRRPRPFTCLPDTLMLQPRKPKDSSFPSGDALRIWFLAISLPIVLEHSLSFSLLLLFIAIIVSLGRTALGVHYPLDILAGSGLGLVAAGIWVGLIFH